MTYSYGRGITGWDVHCGSTSMSLLLDLTVFSLKSFMKDGTAVSWCRLVLQSGVHSRTPIGSQLKKLCRGCCGSAMIFFVEAVAELL